MKKIIFSEGKTLIATEISVSESATPAELEESKISQDNVKALLRYVGNRMEECMNRLENAALRGRIFNIIKDTDGGELIYEYTDGSRKYGHFSVNAYKAMETAVDKLKKFAEQEEVACSEFVKAFNVMEANQMLKAAVTQGYANEILADTLTEMFQRGIMEGFKAPYSL